MVIRHTFEPRGDHVRATLERVEVELLRTLHRQLRAVLTADQAGDPVLGRLFPSTVVGDDDADHELRGFVRGELRGLKLAGLDALGQLLDRGRRQRGGRLVLELRDDEPALVLGVLNDLRLAIGASIGIEDLEREAVDPDDPLAHALAVMDLLAWWQEQLLAILDPAAVRVHEEGEGPGPGTGGPDAPEEG